MTLIDFYSGSNDKLHTACCLSAKVIRQNFKVTIYIPDTTIATQIDKLLWEFSSTEFIPHCHVKDNLALETPVTISQSEELLPHDNVLINLHDRYPPFFSRFLRLIEISETTSEDTKSARRRYRFYKDRGYEIRHHKL
ncbi:MAG: DNA polymerase III subunit chi [Nitrosomonadaceae bacterium]|nr:DNA polymerase III subunit chi [Nitrosomonadaceae bacterium]|tara:strand:- start:697 stop:1110 length:414 start_codon:yes stop_codon:yes gene_type:complete